jgi:hypothetical protein
MARVQIKIPREVVQKYLNEKEGRKVDILEYEKLGSGWHGTGYKIKFRVKGVEKSVVLRTLMPTDFSHDYIADRAKVFLTQHEMAHDIPKHIASFDVSGYTKDNKLVSLGDVREFFQIVEVASGTVHAADFQRIKESGVAIPLDLEKAKILSDYLVELHSKKMKGTPEEIRSIRRRHTRDALGHGEMMMGVVDTYPDNYSFISKKRMTKFICSAARFREETKDVPFEPCRMHGDIHPSNIMFSGKKLAVLDCSREMYGDPADDVITMAINYIWFSVMQSGGFDGPFAKMFHIFWDNYMKKTKDKTIVKTAGIHFAFRGVVVAHPVFYSAQTDDVRRKMIAFAENVLKDDQFHPNKIQGYLRG